MTSDILDLCGRRRSPKKRRKEGPLAMQNYSQVHQAIRGKLKQAKENWITARRKEIGCGIRTGNSKTVFHTLKLLTQRQQTKKKAIHKQIHKSTTNPQTIHKSKKAIHKRWTEYCTELYNWKLKTNANASILKSEDDVENRETGDLTILKEEV